MASGIFLAGLLDPELVPDLSGGAAASFTAVASGGWGGALGVGLGDLAFAAIISSLVWKTSGLWFLISSDCSSLKGFLGVEKLGSSAAFALVAGSGIGRLRS